MLFHFENSRPSKISVPCLTLRLILSLPPILPGPALEDNASFSNPDRGLLPRVFEFIFNQIAREALLVRQQMHTFFP